MVHVNTVRRIACTCTGLILVMLLGGCPSPATPGNFANAGDFGATQGGVQDMGAARELIASGRVPPPEAFVVEGMFSEHDLGLEGEACDRVLCLRSAIGIAPSIDGESSGWLQVGLSSTIDPDTFERPSLSLIATVDVSGSMGWEYTTPNTEYPTPGEVSRNLLSAIAAELGPQDQIAIVTYGTESQTVLPLTNGEDQVTIQAAIDALSTGGVTAMEAGLQDAYALAEEAGGVTEQVRVMLFTDLQPNVGATEPSEFEEIVANGANGGVGLTVMGVGVGLGQELLNAISHLRGGNAFSLFDNEDVTDLLTDDWPFLVSPIAYNLTMEVTLSAGFEVADAYGFPSGDDEVATGYDVATVFLSRRKGALLLRLAAAEAEEFTGMSVSGDLSYDTPDGQAVTESIESTYAGEPLDERGQFFEQDSVGATVALAVLVSAMNQAATEYAEDQELAIGTMQVALARFSGDVESLNNDALTAEVELAGDLLELMKQGAEQGDLYGYGIDGW